jgi:chromosome segregation ATPase
MLGIVAALIIGMTVGNIPQQYVSSSSGGGVASQTKIADLQDQIDRLTKKNMQSQHDLNAAEATVKQLQTQLNQTTADKQQLENEMSNLKQIQEKSSQGQASRKAEAELKDLQIRLNETERGKQRPEERIIAMNAILTNAVQTLEVKKAELSKTLDDLQDEKNLEKLSRQAASTQEVLQQLQADKMRLAELEKQVPTERSELKEY